jgi:hypothetical protein
MAAEEKRQEREGKELDWSLVNQGYFEMLIATFLRHGRLRKQSLLGSCEMRLSTRYQKKLHFCVSAAYHVIELACAQEKHHHARSALYRTHVC